MDASLRRICCLTTDCAGADLVQPGRAVAGKRSCVCVRPLIRVCPRQVLPIIFCISAACGLVAYQIGAHGTIHEDVTWTKAQKKQGVAANYDKKYPGVHNACRAGPQKVEKEHH